MLDTVTYGVNKHLRASTPEPLHNTVRYNMVLDITRITVGPQIAIIITYVFYSRYNTVWIANTEIGLDSNNSVIKRLWCNFKLKSYQTHQRIYNYSIYLQVLIKTKRAVLRTRSNMCFFLALKGKWNLAVSTTYLIPPAYWNTNRFTEVNICKVLNEVNICIINHYLLSMAKLKTL